MPENTLYYGDNLDILREYIADASVDLVYLDPPFNSNRNYNVLFRDEKTLQESPAQITAFEDTWHWNEAAERTYHELVTNAPPHVGQMIGALRGFIGTNQMSAYLVMMAIRLVELHRVLKPTGNLFLHCDPTASHYLKIVLDAIFDPRNFRNEIIWRRTNAHNDPKRFGRIHDVILFYQRDAGAFFQQRFTPLPRGHVSERFIKSDERGVYKLENPTGPGPRYGDSGEPWRGFNPTERNRAWAPPRKLCDKLGIDPTLPTRQKLEALLAPIRFR